jgi:acetyl esterase
MTVIQTHPPVVLEPASRAFVEATASPPFLYELTPAEARKMLDDVQAAPIAKLPIEDRWITVAADVGDVNVRIVRPPGSVGTLPAILYIGGSFGRRQVLQEDASRGLKRFTPARRRVSDRLRRRPGR